MGCNQCTGVHKSGALTSDRTCRPVFVLPYMYAYVHLIVLPTYYPTDNNRAECIQVYNRYLIIGTHHGYIKPLPHSPTYMYNPYIVCMYMYMYMYVGYVFISDDVLMMSGLYACLHVLRAGIDLSAPTAERHDATQLRSPRRTAMGLPLASVRGSMTLPTIKLWKTAAKVYAHLI
ncbi:hypothetical protein F4859DRAFT_112414 [Xylaria cf. heliscus]|nr:hypothetical protein F4859DRAFT_112414 [Xylaria cf. heliscus]